MRRGVHAAPAFWHAAIARSIVFAIKQAVVVGQLFAGLDIAQSNNPNVSRNDVGFAVGLTGMVDKRSNAVAIDHVLAAVETEEIRHRHVIIEIVGLLVAQAFADVLHDESAFSDSRGGVTTTGMNARFLKDEGHGGRNNLYHSPTGLRQ